MSLDTICSNCACVSITRRRIWFRRLLYTSVTALASLSPVAFFPWHSFSPPHVSANECKCPCWWNISPACNLGSWCGHPVMDCMPNRQWKEQGTGNKILMTLSGLWRGLMLAKTGYRGLGRPLGFALILQAGGTLLLTTLTLHLGFMGSPYIIVWIYSIIYIYTVYPHSSTPDLAATWKAYYVQWALTELR